MKVEIVEQKARPCYPPKNPLKWLIWCFFGNDDDGYIGDSGWNPTREDTWKVRLRWWIRNPFHNLFFYVIGCQGKDTIVYGFPSKGVFNPKGGWTFVLTKCGWVYLPFISYIGPIKFYIGWRFGGCLGAKLTLNSNGG